MKKFYLSGNNDGDFIRLVQYKSQEKDCTVYLEIGHCCVITVRHQIPVEYLTTLITENVLKHSDIHGAVKDVFKDFSNEYTEDRISKVKEWI